METSELCAYEIHIFPLQPFLVGRITFHWGNLMQFNLVVILIIFGLVGLKGHESC